MLSMIEKVLTLKSTAFFAKAEENILANIADTLKEVEIEAGETIIKQDQLGDCMYIILEGQVEILNHNQSLARLTAGDVFGEMALLDPAPRSASARAFSHTHLLRLDAEPFKELISDYPEVAQSIMQVLARRLRQVQVQVPPGQPKGKGSLKEK